MKRWLLCLFFFSVSCFGEIENRFSSISAVEEQRFQNLIVELRCLVCQNQSLAESNAPLAIDLKNEVRSKIHAGLTDEEIKKLLVNRYGSYILFKPPFISSTFVLWLGPFIFLVGAFIILFLSIKRQTTSNNEAGHF